MLLKPESLNIEDYLQPDEQIDFHAPLVQAKIQELFNGDFSETKTIEIGFTYVRDHIQHSGDTPGNVITKTASEVLIHREGICYAESILLAALLRSQGIPTGFCCQRILLAETPDQGYCIHALNAVYLSAYKAWTRIDATGNNELKNAQFYPEMPLKEQLAFNTREDIDERDYPVIYTVLPQILIDVLYHYTDCNLLLQSALPDEL